MPPVRGSWTRAELETYLEEALVPVRVACHHPSGGLWMVSLWYEYDEGEIVCATGEDSAIASFLRADPSVSFEISTNRPPYMGVRGNGTVTLSSDEGLAQLRSLLQRYLGETDGPLAQQLLRADRSELRLAIEPNRLSTWDFSERMGTATREGPAATAPPPASPIDRG